MPEHRFDTGGEETGPEPLWDRLERRRILTGARVGAVLRDMPMSAFVAPPMAAVAPLDAPLPTAMAGPSAILPPPRLLALLLQMLEVEEGVSVLLLGSTGGYVEALLARLAEPAPVTVWEEDAELAAVAARALAAVGLGDRVTFVAGPPEGRFDRVTTVEQVVRVDAKARASIADMGFAVYRAHREDLQFVKLLRSGDEYLELSTGREAGEKDAASGVRRPRGLDVGRELVLGRMLENVCARREETDHDRHFCEVADETFARPEALPPMAPAEQTAYDAAKMLFQLAYVYQSAGEWDTAIEVYEASLAVRPTAESHTFLGWVRSFQERYAEAIAECEKAIAVDPTFGNPYNDIGAYLIELGRLDEAIPWFERAKGAKRYCCYFYPYSNLGRVYMMKGMHARARREFEAALRINPQYEYAREMLRRVGRESDYIA